jgi:hypothetical protein
MTRILARSKSLMRPAALCPLIWRPGMIFKDTKFVVLSACETRVHFVLPSFALWIVLRFDF